MIQCYIYLNKKSNLFKNLKKRGFIEYDFLYINILEKPSIGELIKIDSTSIKNEEFISDSRRNFMKYLDNRIKPIYLRIKDLCSHTYNTKNPFFVIDLKCEEELDWLN